MRASGGEEAAAAVSSSAKRSSFSWMAFPEVHDISQQGYLLAHRFLLRYSRALTMGTLCHAVLTPPPLVGILWFLRRHLK
jgi:hypothetical protein